MMLNEEKKNLQIEALDKNAHIPGYKGHCPKIGQVVGQRFSESSKISYLMYKKDKISSEEIKTQRDSNNNNNSNYNNNYNNNNYNNNNYKANYNNNYNNNIHNTTKNYNGNSNDNLNLPSYNNYNRYTKNMISGYTGYIPNQATGFGKTFTHTSNDRLTEHFRNMQTYKEEDRERYIDRERRNEGKTHITMKDVNGEMMQYLHAQSLHGNSQQPRQPIGGYQGHIPMKGVAEGSVGVVDALATRNALQTSHRQHNDYSTMLTSYRKQLPLTCQCK